MARYYIRNQPISRLLTHPRLKFPARTAPFNDYQLCTLLDDLHSAMLYNDYDYFFGSIILMRNPNETLTVADGRKRLVTVATILARIKAKLFSLMFGVRLPQRGPRRAVRIIDDFLDSVIADTPNSSSESTLQSWLDFIEDGVMVVTATGPRAAYRRARHFTPALR